MEHQGLGLGFILFYSEIAPTDPWCNMLCDFTWTENEEAMSDEHPT